MVKVPNSHGQFCPPPGPMLLAKIRLCPYPRILPHKTLLTCENINESQYLGGDSLYKSGSSKTFSSKIYVILTWVPGVARDDEWRNLLACSP